jgi:hypothetical protein
LVLFVIGRTALLLEDSFVHGFDGVRLTLFLSVLSVPDSGGRVDLAETSRA